MGRVVDAIAAALYLRDDGDVHITFLREFLLREFLIASRLADGVAGGAAAVAADIGKGSG